MIEVFQRRLCFGAGRDSERAVFPKRPAEKNALQKRTGFRKECVMTDTVRTEERFYV